LLGCRRCEVDVDAALVALGLGHSKETDEAITLAIGVSGRAKPLVISVRAEPVTPAQKSERRSG
jgi:hypothetical protein